MFCFWNKNELLTKVPLLLIAIFISVTASAQWMLINETGGDPNSSAALEIADTSRGLLPPRMNSSQMNNIASPAEGLLVYNTDSNAYVFYNGSSWMSLVNRTELDTTLKPVSSVYNSGVVVLRDEKASGVDGGTFTSGAWRTRDLNTIDGDTTIVSLSSNQFTLDPGVYLISATAPAANVQSHFIRLRNVTTSVTVAHGTSQYTDTNDDDFNSSHLNTVVQVVTGDVFELQHLCDVTRATWGFGWASANITTPVYAQVVITKLD